MVTWCCRRPRTEATGERARPQTTGPSDFRWQPDGQGHFHACSGVTAGAPDPGHTGATDDQHDSSECRPIVRGMAVEEHEIRLWLPATPFALRRLRLPAISIVSVVVSLLHSLRFVARSRASLDLEIIALRHQLVVLDGARRPRLPFDAGRS
jgi:hypothetical protein